MAIKHHIEILAKGVDAWNEWVRLQRLSFRGPPTRHAGTKIGAGSFWADLSGADLRGADLYQGKSGAGWSGIDLVGADLRKSDLRSVNLAWSNLIGATLAGADLSGAILMNARLEGADLSHTNLSAAALGGASLLHANLEGAQLENAYLSSTNFSDTDLAGASGLEACRHGGPCTVDHRTLLAYTPLPPTFLRGCGLPEILIEYLPSLRGAPIGLYSCFVSYSSKDSEFASRIYADLQSNGVRCWKFDEDAKWGEPLWGEIDNAIRYYDKLVVICSEHSLQSPAVVREIERALQKEDREHRSVLFPVRLDDYLLETWDHARKADVVSKVIGDFRGAHDSLAYGKAFARFLAALRRGNP